MSDVIRPEVALDTVQQENQRLRVKVGELTKLADHLKQKLAEVPQRNSDQGRV